MVTIPRAKCLYTQLSLLVVVSFLTAATANGQQLTLSPARIDFGNVRLGANNSQTVTVTNIGNGGTCGTCGTSVTISAASASGSGFSLSGISLPLTLKIGQSTSFSVNFVLTAVAVASGTVKITSDASKPILSIPLSGTVIQGNLWPMHATINFARVEVGSITSQTEKLTNNGGTSVTISATHPSNAEFSLKGLSVPQTLPPGGSISFEVAFRPDSAKFVSEHITIVSDGANRVLNIVLNGAGGKTRDVPECSVAKTNNACKIVIDRANPVAPPTLQMYSKQVLTVIVKNPKTYERYFLDYQIGQAGILPEVAPSIVQGLLPSLGKLQILGGRYAAPLGGPTDSCATAEITRTPAPQHVVDVVPAFQECVEQIAARAVDVYRELEPDLFPDSHTPNGVAAPVDLQLTQRDISDFLKSEFFVSSRISAIATDSALKTSAPDGDAILQLTNLQKLIDGVANDLMGYALRLNDLKDFNNGAQVCANLFVKKTDDKVQCVVVESNPDDDLVYNNMVTRTITYSLNALNLISSSQAAAPDSSKKRSLASILINFADSSPSKKPGAPFSALRWEASAGAFFSFLPVRSFSVAPIFSGGQVMDNKVAQNILHPTVVPFAAANYRLYDLPRTRWRYAIYWTGAVGVNPNTVSADFASGLSISWRSLMFSPLWHYGHDVRLTQGFYVGESLGSGFKGSLPTQTYWKSSFALGVSIRVPSLTGR